MADANRRKPGEEADLTAAKKREKDAGDANERTTKALDNAKKKLKEGGDVDVDNKKKVKDAGDDVNAKKPKSTPEEAKAEGVVNGGKKTKKKLKDMTEDERKAFFASRGAAAAASRAQSKAKTAEPSSASEEPSESSAESETEDLGGEDDEEEVKPVVWEHDFGEGMKSYERVDHDGMTYIYDIKSKAYLGAYMEKTNKLNTKVPNPSA